jgi:phosphotransferase system enzyme I (PtsP)
MVLAEMVASGAFGDLTGLAEVEALPSRPELLTGRSFSDGICIGTAVLHEPHAPLGRVIADDPIKEGERLDNALAQVRKALADMLEGDPGRISGVSRDVLETFLMLANDPSWETKLRAGVHDDRIEAGIESGVLGKRGHGVETEHVGEESAHAVFHALAGYHARYLPG